MRDPHFENSCGFSCYKVKQQTTHLDSLLEPSADDIKSRTKLIYVSDINPITQYPKLNQEFCLAKYVFKIV